MSAIENPNDTRRDAARQYVTFSVANETFAVPLEPVQEIIRAPQVAQLPLAPPALAGLANLRGRVLPILDLRYAFGLPHREADDATRAVVIGEGLPLGFLVDQVCSVIEVQPEAIQAVDQLQTVTRMDLLTGVIQLPRVGASGVDLVLVLDYERVIHEQLAHTQRALKAQTTVHRSLELESRKEAHESKTKTELRLVSFTVAGQEYGVDIAEVREIVQCPEEVIELPNAEPHVLGLMSLRQKLLPLVGLRRLFGMNETERDERQRVVVVALPDGNNVGLVTDTVKEVLSVPQDSAEPMPSLWSRENAMSEFSAICRLDGGRRLLSVLSISQLPGVGGLQTPDADVIAPTQSGQLLPNAPTSTQENRMNASPKDDVQVVVFRLDGEEYGVPIMSVQEIVRVPEVLTRVPKTPECAEGVINLRGTVLPVIDQRSSMGLTRCDRNDRQRIMVYHIGRQRTGFIVDSVAEVMRINSDHIEPAPELSPEQAALIQQVAKLDGGRRLVMLVDTERLISLAYAQKGQAAPTPGEAGTVSAVVVDTTPEKTSTDLPLAA